MNVKDYLLQEKIDPNSIKKTASSKDEITDLFGIVKRDLKDGQISLDMSLDWQFGITYNAVLKLCTIVVRSEGMRVSSGPHHLTTIKLLPFLLGDKYRSLSRYLNSCRVKRNKVEYDRVGGVSEKEVQDLIKETIAFKSDVEQWMYANHPELMPS